MHTFYVIQFAFVIEYLFINCELVGANTDFDEENELTITVWPGQSECFFQKAKIGQTVEIEYQVTDASFGDVEIHHDLDINFRFFSPGGRELISDYKKSDAIHRHDVSEDGDYKFCFDNTFSTFTKKTVFFDVYVDSEGDDFWGDLDLAFPPELVYNDTMDQIKRFVAKVHENLNQVKHHQDQLKAIESRDRNLQEHNFTRVNQFSLLIIIVMMIVGAVQVLMVRSLFEEKSKLHKIFKLIS